MADYTPEQEVRVKDLLKLTDYYQILGVGKDCTPSQLKKAYLKLAKEFHPDRNRAPGSTKATQLLVKAYTVLADPEKRQKYDAEGSDEEVEEEDVRDFNYEEFENFFRHFETQMAEDDNRAADPERTKKFCFPKRPKKFCLYFIFGSFVLGFFGCLLYGSIIFWPF